MGMRLNVYSVQYRLLYFDDFPKTIKLQSIKVTI